MMSISFPFSTLCISILLASTIICAPSQAQSTLRSASASSRRQLQEEDSTGCSTRIATSVADNELAASYGIIFTIESAVTDNVGPVVASLGFHVETNFISESFFSYEVYTLNSDGYYADPERTDNLLDELSYDYRGVLDQWSLVSSGQIDKSELRVDEETVSSSV